MPGLIVALKHEKSTYWALLILRGIGPAAKEAVPAVIEVLKDTRPEIRREAVLTLGAIADKSAAPQIAELIGDPQACTAATFVLGQFGELPAAAEAICRENCKCDNKLLATVSLWALARVHPDDKNLRREATEELVARDSSDKDPVRSRCRRSCSGRIAAGAGDYRSDLGKGAARRRCSHNQPRTGRAGLSGSARSAAADRRLETAQGTR